MDRLRQKQRIDTIISSGITAWFYGFSIGVWSVGRWTFPQYYGEGDFQNSTGETKSFLTAADYHGRHEL